MLNLISLDVSLYPVSSHSFSNANIYAFIWLICLFVQYTCKKKILLVVYILYILHKIILYSQQSVGGIAVSIAAFQAVDPGSTPGHRSPFFFFLIKIINGICKNLFIFFIVLWFDMNCEISCKTVLVVWSNVISIIQA